MSGLMSAVKEVCEYLGGCIAKEQIQFSKSFEYVKAPMLENCSSGFVGIAAAEYVDCAPMETKEGLCKALKLTMRIEIVTPKNRGGSVVRSLFDKIAEALFASQFAVRKISSGEMKFDTKLQALTLEALVDIEFMVVLEDTRSSQFNGYELRKEVFV